MCVYVYYCVLLRYLSMYIVRQCHDRDTVDFGRFLLVHLALPYFLHSFLQLIWSVLLWHAKHIIWQDTQSQTCVTNQFNHKIKSMCVCVCVCVCWSEFTTQLLLKWCSEMIRLHPFSWLTITTTNTHTSGNEIEHAAFQQSEVIFLSWNCIYIDYYHYKKEDRQKKCEGVRK